MSAGGIVLTGLLVVATSTLAAEALRERASTALARDDLESAIGLLRELVDNDRRPNDVKQLADALAWSGSIDEACALYRELREKAPDDPELRLAHAYALSWSDLPSRQSAALKLMEAHLAERPDDPAVRLARAQLLSWVGRTDEAIEAFDAYLDDHPEDASAKLALARALRWSEGPAARDRAGRILRSLTGEAPVDEEVRRELDLLERDLRPLIQPSFSLFLDSSRIFAWASGAKVSVRRSHRLHLGAEVELWNLGASSAPAGPDRIWAQRADAFAGYEVVDGLSLQARIGTRTQSDDYSRVALAGAARVGWAVAEGADLALEYRYDDVYSSILQPRAAIDRVRGSLLSLDVSWHAPWPFEVQARAAGRDVGSAAEPARSNRSVEGSCWLGYEVIEGLRAGYRGEYLHWVDTDPAYWSPQLYHAHYGELRLGGDDGPFTYGAELRIGGASSRDGNVSGPGLRPAWAGGVRLEWRPVWWLRVAAELYSGSTGQGGESTAKGYWWLSGSGSIGVRL